MEESQRRFAPAADDPGSLLGIYLEERIRPHPILNRHLDRMALSVVGSVALGAWDEESELDLTFVLPDDELAELAAALREARLWDPARDPRVFLRDREPFRRLPGAAILILSRSQLRAEFDFDLPVALWAYRHACTLQDPLGTLEEEIHAAEARFQERLEDLRCEHYYRFRLARKDLVPKLVPHRLSTLLAIKRGEAVREALRIAFLADGKPYPYDKWLEPLAERETRCGSSIISAVRALIAAREPHTIEHAGKVLRDRVAFALLQGGVDEPWLEQWWLWPSVAAERAPRPE